MGCCEKQLQLFASATSARTCRALHVVMMLANTFAVLLSKFVAMRLARPMCMHVVNEASSSRWRWRWRHREQDSLSSTTSAVHHRLTNWLSKKMRAMFGINDMHMNSQAGDWLVLCRQGWHICNQIMHGKALHRPLLMPNLLQCICIASSSLCLLGPQVSRVHVPVDACVDDDEFTDLLGKGAAFLASLQKQGAASVCRFVCCSCLSVRSPSAPSKKLARVSASTHANDNERRRQATLTTNWLLAGPCGGTGDGGVAKPPSMLFASFSLSLLYHHFSHTLLSLSLSCPRCRVKYAPSLSSQRASRTHPLPTRSYPNLAAPTQVACTPHNYHPALLKLHISTAMGCAQSTVKDQVQDTTTPDVVADIAAPEAVVVDGVAASAAPTTTEATATDASDATPAVDVEAAPAETAAPVVEPEVTSAKTTADVADAEAPATVEEEVVVAAAATTVVEEEPAAPAVAAVENEAAPVEAAKPEVAIEETALAAAEEASGEPETEAVPAVDETQVTGLVFTSAGVSVGDKGVAYYNFAGSNAEDPAQDVKISKRFNDFKALHAEIATIMANEANVAPEHQDKFKAYPALPAMPKTSLFRGRNNPKQTEEREAQFLKILNAIARHPIAAESTKFKAFLA